MNFIFLDFITLIHQLLQFGHFNVIMIFRFAYCLFLLCNPLIKGSASSSRYHLHLLNQFNTDIIDPFLDIDFILFAVD